MEKKGKLIIIEAGDGSGKATQTKALYEHLCREGYRAVTSAAMRKMSMPMRPRHSSPSTATRRTA